ncbi:hypothetical protein N3114_05820 [Aliarcobacter butzleri]|uniref:hypothetical protein n=1 Tax=Aliarcobacter butzleri TaxID=28197 RepID=UPI0021B3B625|nr:hypothetical protein [Aliarcobacter butzleri]UXC30536.1 hypothetical protein N3114_05820 [Aliarcobacter butzleri]
MIKQVYNELIKAFASRDGQIVVAFIFGSMFFISLIAAIFTNEGNMFVGIFALFAILSSIFLFKKAKNENEK